MIDIARLIAAGIAPTQARIFAAPLHKACDRFDITTPARIGAFIGQCRVESKDFTRLEEDLRYRKPEVLNRNFSAVHGLDDAARLIKAGPKAIANRVYANRNGNGDEASGDGWRFRGRGLIQITGRDKYEDAGIDLGRPYLLLPEIVAEPDDACLTAAWYWHTHKLNVLADASLFDEITRAVNGRAMLHADLRRQYSEEAIEALA